MFAYMVRFLAVAVGQVDSSLEKVSPSMDMAARTLGFRAGATLVRYHLPLIKGGLLTAAMVVFVDCMKELPATLLLRPFNFETLATYVYRFASDEMLGEAALGSLTIVAVGLLPVLFLQSDDFAVAPAQCRAFCRRSLMNRADQPRAGEIHADPEPLL